MLNTHSIQQLPSFLNPYDPIQGIRRFGISNVLGPTLKLFTNYFWLTTRIVFVVVAPFEVFKALSLSNPQDDLLLRAEIFFLGAICNVLIAPALIYALMKIMHTREAPGVNESYRWGLTKLGRLAVCAAISWVLQMLGYMFFIIPGIIISLALALVYPVAVLEKGSPADVLRRSSELTRGYRFEILIAIILTWLLTAVITVPASFLSQNIVWPLAVLAAIIEDVMEQALTVLALIMYLSLLHTRQSSHSILSATK